MERTHFGREFRSADVYYHFLSPDGIESKTYTAKEAEKVLKKGVFEHEVCIDTYALGPSTQSDYRTDILKIAGVRKVSYESYRVTEDFVVDGTEIALP